MLKRPQGFCADLYLDGAIYESGRVILLCRRPVPRKSCSGERAFQLRGRLGCSSFLTLAMLFLTIRYAWYVDGASICGIIRL
jgi:hypothetical protein